MFKGRLIRPSRAPLRAPRNRRRRSFFFESLEKRIVLAQFCVTDACQEIELVPEFDQFGPQVETVQGFQLQADLALQQGGGGTTGEWTNIQYTWDQTAGELHIFQDGTEVAYLDEFDPQILGWDSVVQTTAVVLLGSGLTA